MKAEKSSCKGAITVEAAISLPLFIIAIITFVFIIKVYYTHEIIQQAITGACNEMSLYTLLYYETNAEDLIEGIEKFGTSEISNMFGDNDITAFVRQKGGEAADYIRAQIALVPVTKALVKKNLETDYYDEPDDRLKGLHMKDGFGGINFAGSRMLADGRSIDISAEYEITLPFLSQVFPGIRITQTASSCVWAGEEGVKNYDEDDNGQEAGIWDMSNIKRGQEIRKLQGANLPYNFPVIARFENGTASSIKSLNIDKDYYKDTKNLKIKLVSYINKLDEFEGGSNGKVTVGKYQIIKKELVLVIPETQVLSNQQQILDECSQIAQSKGISLKIIKAYGRESNQNNSAGNEAGE